jgi:hypothetical protein
VGSLRGRITLLGRITFAAGPDHIRCWAESQTLKTRTTKCGKGTAPVFVRDSHTYKQSNQSSE